MLVILFYIQSIICVASSRVLQNYSLRSVLDVYFPKPQVQIEHDIEDCEFYNNFKDIVHVAQSGLYATGIFDNVQKIPVSFANNDLYVTSNGRICKNCFLFAEFLGELNLNYDFKLKPVTLRMGKTLKNVTILIDVKSGVDKVFIFNNNIDMSTYLPIIYNNKIMLVNIKVMVTHDTSYTFVEEYNFTPISITEIVDFKTSYSMNYIELKNLLFVGAAGDIKDSENNIVDFPSLFNDLLAPNTLTYTQYTTSTTSTFTNITSTNVSTSTIIDISVSTIVEVSESVSTTTVAVSPPATSVPTVMLSVHLANVDLDSSFTSTFLTTTTTIIPSVTIEYEPVTFTTNYPDIIENTTIVAPSTTTTLTVDLPVTTTTESVPAFTQITSTFPNTEVPLTFSESTTYTVYDSVETIVISTPTTIYYPDATVTLTETVETLGLPQAITSILELPVSTNTLPGEIITISGSTVSTTITLATPSTTIITLIPASTTHIVINTQPNVTIYGPPVTYASIVYITATSITSTVTVINTTIIPAPVTITLPQSTLTITHTVTSTVYVPNAKTVSLTAISTNF